MLTWDGARLRSTSYSDVNVAVLVSEVSWQRHRVEVCHIGGTLDIAHLPGTSVIYPCLQTIVGAYSLGAP